VPPRTITGGGRAAPARVVARAACSYRGQPPYTRAPDPSTSGPVAAAPGLVGGHPTALAAGVRVARSLTPDVEVAGQGVALAYPRAGHTDRRVVGATSDLAADDLGKHVIHCVGDGHESRDGALETEERITQIGGGADSGGAVRVVTVVGEVAKVVAHAAEVVVREPNQAGRVTLGFLEVGELHAGMLPDLAADRNLPTRSVYHGS